MASKARQARLCQVGIAITTHSSPPRQPSQTSTHTFISIHLFPRFLIRILYDEKNWREKLKTSHWLSGVLIMLVQLSFPAVAPIFSFSLACSTFFHFDLLCTFALACLGLAPLILSWYDCYFFNWRIPVCVNGKEFVVCWLHPVALTPVWNTTQPLSYCQNLPIVLTISQIAWIQVKHYFAAWLRAWSWSRLWS